jgi:predicted Zn finger-like uncharacterized protein
MRIVCPSCDAEYEVPASRLTSRRMVRCARCGGEWMAAQETPEPPPDPDPESSAEPVVQAPTLTAMDRLASNPPPLPRPSRLIAAWIMTFVVLASAVAATIIWRGAIVRAWPPSSLILGSPGGSVPHPPEKPEPPQRAPQPAKE